MSATYVGPCFDGVKLESEIEPQPPSVYVMEPATISLDEDSLQAIKDATFVLQQLRDEVFGLKIVIRNLVCQMEASRK